MRTRSLDQVSRSRPALTPPPARSPAPPLPVEHKYRVSYFTVPPRAHPSSRNYTSERGGGVHRLKGRLRSPRSTQVLSTRSLGLLNFANQVRSSSSSVKRRGFSSVQFELGLRERRAAASSRTGQRWRRPSTRGSGWRTPDPRVKNLLPGTHRLTVRRHSPRSTQVLSTRSLGFRFFEDVSLARVVPSFSRAPSRSRSDSHA